MITSKTIQPSSYNNDLLSSYVTQSCTTPVISTLHSMAITTRLASFQMLHDALWAGDPLFCHHEFKNFQRSNEFFRSCEYTLMSLSCISTKKWRSQGDLHSSITNTNRVHRFLCFETKCAPCDFQGHMHRRTWLAVG